MQFVFQVAEENISLEELKSIANELKLIGKKWSEIEKSLPSHTTANQLLRFAVSLRYIIIIIIKIYCFYRRRDFSREVLTYSIYACVNLFSQNERARN